MTLITTDPYVKIPGTPYIALSGDEWITPACLRAGRLDWDRSLLDVPEVDAVLRPGAVVIDVGAYIGDTTRLMLDRGCRVIAFEPQPDAFLCLLRNCYDAGAEMYKAPAGDGSEVQLQHADGGNMGARQVWNGRIPAGRGVHPARVRTLRIDDLSLPRCDFIKIDVEGFEPWVLDGARETIARCRPVLVIEVSLIGLADHGRDAEDIVARLPGYDRREIDPNRVPFDWVCTPSEGRR